MGYMKALAIEAHTKLQELLEYFEKERQRGLKIHEEMDKLMSEGMANDEQEVDWSYYEGYADAMAAAINKLAEKFLPEQ